MTISKTRRTAIGAAIGTALTVALSTAAFTPVFASPLPATIEWTSTISNGDAFLFGQVPAEPTCAAVTDEVDVTKTCVVEGYNTAVGEWTLTATATVTSIVDPLDATVTTDIRVYDVLPWTLKGFYKPVKMTSVNKIKGGSTVPLKFKVYKGTKKATSKTAVASILAQQVDCTLATPIGVPTSVTSTKKGLTLKYNDGAFHQNWKSPKLAVTKIKGKKTVTPACYLVTMTTQDGSALSASFLLK